MLGCRWVFGLLVIQYWGNDMRSKKRLIRTLFVVFIAAPVYLVSAVGSMAQQVRVNLDWNGIGESEKLINANYDGNSGFEDDDDDDGGASPADDDDDDDSS